jgi:single-stranded-DNA-specific exonuclease
MPKIIWEDSNAVNYSLNDNVSYLILQKRGLSPKELESFLNPNYDSLNDPFIIPNMKIAVERIKSAIKNNDKIVIYGDYDIDGLSSSALMKDAFFMMGTTLKQLRS